MIGKKFSAAVPVVLILFGWLCGSSHAGAPVNDSRSTVSPMTVQRFAQNDSADYIPIVGSEPQLAIMGFQRSSDSRKASKKEVSDGSDEKADIILLSDLPKLEINEEALKKRQIIGHDELIESELRRLLSEFGEDSKIVPEIFLNEVKLYIRAYRQNPQYRKFIAASLKRSARYMDTVKKIFGKRNIPEDMAYIAFIESGFNPNARSRAGALGMWQFMPGTARDYSLKVSKRVDERLDPVRSTYAACEYFHDLIAIFGPRSFLLALAAYNSGEGKVISCLKRIDNPLQERTFWHIRPCLALESREYPPRIIAAAIIGNNPEVFGFSRNGIIDEDIEVVRERNTDTVVQNVIPRTVAQTIRTGIIRTAGDASNTASVDHKAKGSHRGMAKPLIYKVKKGNTLDGVAEAFHVSRDDIKRWNQLKGNKILAGAHLKVYSSVPLQSVTYTVRKGDTIREIGQSFGVRPVRIIVCNGLRDGVGIRPGQTIVVYREMKEKPTIHKVQKGSTLTRIAEAFDVRAKDIMRWNNLDSPSVFPNQRLRIYRDVKGV